MEQFRTLIRNPVFTAVSAGVSGIVAGAISSHIYTRRKYDECIRLLAEELDNQLAVTKELQDRLDEIASDVGPQIEIPGVREFVVTPEDHPDMPDNTYEEIMLVTTEPEVEEPVTVNGHNIFDGSGDDSWDYDVELAKRDPTKPYVIHADEFVADERGYDSQTTLTYYEADDILTDSKDVPLYNYTDITGELKWGHGSLDPNVVYIRNERLKAEYEILRDPGSFQEIVLGKELERNFEAGDIRHAHRVFKMRDFD